MLQRRKSPYDSIKVNRVGAFGEALAQALIPHFQLAAIDEGDFYIPSLNSGVEVKVTDSLHEWRLPLHQLEAFQKLSLFPYDGFWFFLFVYRNWYVPNGKPRGSTALSAYNEECDVRSFMADNMQRVYVLSLEFVLALMEKKICRVADKSIPLHPGRESLNIRPARLRSLISEDSWKEVVPGYGDWVAQTRGIKFRCRPNMFETYDVPLEAHVIGPEREAKRIFRLMAGEKRKKKQPKAPSVLLPIHSP